MTSYNQPWQIISDGQILYVVDAGKALKIVDPYMKSYSMALRRDCIDVTTLGDPSPVMVPGNAWVDFSFDVMGGSVQQIENSDVLLDFFHSASIRDLLSEINKKVDMRAI